MNNEHSIVLQVYAAKENIQTADDFIRTYLPFIKAETAKFLKRPPVEGQDDELAGLCLFGNHRSLDLIQDHGGLQRFFGHDAIHGRSFFPISWESGQ